jgi:hypothetical protein
MLQPGELVPHFEVTTVEGEPFSYSSIWQRKNLVLVCLPSVNSETAGYVATLTVLLREANATDVASVITRDSVPGLPASGVVVADRWGEIMFATEASGIGDLPTARELVEWLTFVRNRCPECEGEAR